MENFSNHGPMPSALHQPPNQLSRSRVPIHARTSSELDSMCCGGMITARSADLTSRVANNLLSGLGTFFQLLDPQQCSPESLIVCFASTYDTNMPCLSDPTSTTKEQAFHLLEPFLAEPRAGSRYREICSVHAAWGRLWPARGAKRGPCDNLSLCRHSTA